MNPLSFSAYRQLWDRAYISDPVIPLNLDIELASFCNLACPFCFWGDDQFISAMNEKSEDGKMKKRLMPLDMALGLINEADRIKVPALKFNWRGESTLHPHYTAILTHAAAKGTFHEILVNSNGNCPPGAIDGLMAATKVMISLDSTKPETYKIMRKGGDLKKALATISILIDRGHRNLWVRRVVNDINRFEDFRANVREIFGDKVKISEHQEFNRNRVYHPDMPFERTYCGYPSQRLIIASDGRIFPCCVDFDETMPLGTYPKDTVLWVWNSPAMAKLRKDLRRNILESASCKNCTSYMAFKVPERESVQDKALP